MPGVKKLEILSRQPVFEGMAFGKDGCVGSYELVSGRAHCEIDPDAPLNREVANLAHAPRAANGLVEYSVDFHIYKPADLARGNGCSFTSGSIAARSAAWFASTMRPWSHCRRSRRT